MCGIAGVLAPNGLDRDCARTLGAMGQMLAHRGPDAADLWSDAPAGIGFAHRRLSIIDLSPHGAQPMHSACGRYVISYNGELYNFRELRAELEAVSPPPPWRGHSDTEVML